MDRWLSLHSLLASIATYYYFFAHALVTFAVSLVMVVRFDPASADPMDAEQRAVAAMVDDAGRAGLSLDALTSRAGRPG